MFNGVWRADRAVDTLQGVAELTSPPVYEDAEARRRGVLDAAALILDEHGYAQMTIRNVAARAGTSVGVIYRYFVDKQDIFVALLLESQERLTQFLGALPREEGVANLLARIIPETTLQWARVGRLVATWRQTEAIKPEANERLRGLLDSTDAQFSALRTALLEAARNEGRPLRQDAALIPFVWAGLMGVADTVANNWAADIPTESFVHYSAQALTQAITAYPEHDIPA